MTTTQTRIPPMPADYLPEPSPVAVQLGLDLRPFPSRRIHWLRAHGYTGWVGTDGTPNDLVECDACLHWFDEEYAKAAACALDTYCPGCMADHETECRRCAAEG